MENKELGLLPLVGSALPFGPDKNKIDNFDPGGQLFCFLPLPIEKSSPTGCKVHINGCFAVSQNRSGLVGPVHFTVIA
jgi:hypothetical protein